MMLVLVLMRVQMKASEPRPSRTYRDVGREATRESDKEEIIKERSQRSPPTPVYTGVSDARRKDVRVDDDDNDNDNDNANNGDQYDDNGDQDEDAMMLRHLPHHH